MHVIQDQGRMDADASYISVVVQQAMGVYLRNLHFAKKRLFVQNICVCIQAKRL